VLRPAPGSAVGVDEERVDRVPLGLVREGRLLERRGEACLDVVDLALAEPDRHGARARRLRHRQGHSARLQEFDALVAEPDCVHRVLRVEAVRLDELGPVHPLLAA